MIKWKMSMYDKPKLARVEAYRAIAEQLERFNDFIKYASIGGMVFGAVYLGLKIVGVF